MPTDPDQNETYKYYRLTLALLSPQNSAIATMTTMSSSPSEFQLNGFASDIVLRTNDDMPVDFPVHKCFLAAASPFFNAMFTLPQSPSSCASSTQPPTVSVSEDSNVVGMLLRFIYPLPDPTPHNLDELVSLLCAASKYDMTGVMERLRIHLTSTEYLAESPLRVFAIATRFDFEPEAKIASTHTLGIDVLDSPLSEDLKQITAYSYHRLFTLHRRRAEAAQQVLQSESALGVKCMQCNGSGAHFGTPRWLTHFRAKAEEELKARPTTEVIFSLKFLMEVAQATGCQRCAASILESHIYLETLRGRIDALPATI